MSPTIDRFHGDYAFLSNFYPVRIEYEGKVYPSSENLYQSLKCRNPVEAELIREAPTPAIAKRWGRKVSLRRDWLEVRDAVMLDVLRAKFGSGPLRAALVATGDAELIEGNRHGDVYWGTVDGVGENRLGTLLMQVRAEVAP